MPGLARSAAVGIRVRRPCRGPSRRTGEIGPVVAGYRRAIPITGGYICGPRISGAVLDGRADWQLVSSGGTGVIDTRYMMRTEGWTVVSGMEPLAARATLLLDRSYG
jgi:Protein of unknown function (DUF3237)